MLWDTDLPNLDITYVATEGDVEGAGEDGESGAAAPARWPGGESAPAERPAATPAAAPGASAVEREVDRVFGRSDDHLTHGDHRPARDRLPAPVRRGGPGDRAA